MDVIEGCHIVEHAQTIALPGLKKPLKPTAAVSGKLEKELLLMTLMSDLPR